MVESVRSGEHHPQRGFRRPLQGHNALGQGSGKESNSDALRNEPVSDGYRFIHSNAICQLDARPSGEVRPYFPHRGIETQSCQLTRTIVGAYLECTLMPEHQIQQATVRKFNTLRLTGGTRSVDNIG